MKKTINVTETITAATTKIATNLMLHELKGVWMAIDAKGLGGAIALYERKLSHWTIEDGQKVWNEYKTTLGYLNLVDSLFVRVSLKCSVTVVELGKALATGLRFVWNQLTLAAVTVATAVKRGLQALFALIKKGVNGGKSLLGRLFRKSKDDDEDIVIEVEEVEKVEGDNTPTATPSATKARIVRVWQPTNPDDIVGNLATGATGNGRYTSIEEMEVTATLQAEGEDEGILSMVYTMSQVGDDDFPVHHSISCGDVVEVDGTFYRCIPNGWDKLN